MNQVKTSKLTLMAVFALAGLIAGAALADTQSQSDNPTIGQGSDSCSGTYYAVAVMTNGTGTFWITPPTGTKTGTFTDASAFGGTYHSVASVIRKSDGTSFCTGSNSVTFTANTSSYKMTVFVTSHNPPPANGQAMTLQVTWQ